MDYLWTPWRSTYIKEKRPEGHCVFCAAAASDDEEETLLIYRGQLCFVLLNRYPYTTGHLMIAPYQHASRIGQTTEETTREMMQLARRAERVLEDMYHPDGLNMGLNLGEAAGAGIEQHIHLHVLPRWKGDANFMTTVGHARIMPETLDDTYAKVRPAFEQDVMNPN